MKLFFRQYGQGFPVIILHGLYGMSDNWVSFGRRLAADFQVLIPDLRNHGQSPHSDIFNYPALAEDLKEFLDDRGFHDVMLIGHSLGGKVAMQFSLDHPEYVRRLVIVDISPGAYPENHEQIELMNAMLSVDLANAHSRSVIEKQLQSLVASEKLRQFLLKNVYWESPSKLGWRLNLDGIRKNLDQIFLGIESDKIFEKPVLFVRGGRSTYIRSDDMNLIGKMFPQAIMRDIESATHWVHADEPEKFYDLVSGFLKGTSVPGDRNG